MCRWWMGSLGMSLSNAVNQNIELTPVVLHWPDSICIDQYRFLSFAVQIASYEIQTIKPDLKTYPTLFLKLMPPSHCRAWF
jgi:hypothetical protein